MGIKGQNTVANLLSFLIFNSQINGRKQKTNYSTSFLTVFDLR